jgi:hypothetical protein
LFYPQLVFLKILLELNDAETPEKLQIMIYPVGGRVLGHGRNVLEFVEKVFAEIHSGVIELLDTLAFIHTVAVEWVVPKLMVLQSKSNKTLFKKL